MKLLAVHITNQKLSFNIFMVGKWPNIFMEHNWLNILIFGIKEKSIILTNIVGYCYKYARAAYDWFCAPAYLSLSQWNISIQLGYTLFECVLVTVIIHLCTESY